MSAKKRPRESVVLMWCPVCGRDDRITYLRRELAHRAPSGRMCSGKPEAVVYERRADRIGGAS